MAPLLKMDQNGKTKRSKGRLWTTEYRDPRLTPSGTATRQVVSKSSRLLQSLSSPEAGDRKSSKLFILRDPTQTRAIFNGFTHDSFVEIDFQLVRASERCRLGYKPGYPAEV